MKPALWGVITALPLPVIGKCGCPFDEITCKHIHREGCTTSLVIKLGQHRPVIILDYLKKEVLKNE